MANLISNKEFMRRRKEIKDLYSNLLIRKLKERITEEITKGYSLSRYTNIYKSKISMVSLIPKPPDDETSSDFDKFLEEYNLAKTYFSKVKLTKYTIKLLKNWFIKIGWKKVKIKQRWALNNVNDNRLYFYLYIKAK